MANANKQNDEADEAEGDGDTPELPAAGRLTKKRLIMIAAAAGLLIGSGAGVVYSGLADPVLALVGMGEGGAGGEHAAHAEPKLDPVYYTLPDFVVNLNTPDRRPTYLKVRAELELAEEHDIELIESRLPRITDSFQVYLRELRLEDIRGSAGTYRLREELLRRVSQEAAPAEVRDVLFGEMFIH